MNVHIDGSAGEMVNPAKSAFQVNAESQEGKHLYKVSHQDFEVGTTAYLQITFLYTLIIFNII